MGPAESEAQKGRVEKDSRPVWRTEAKLAVLSLTNNKQQ